MEKDNVLRNSEFYVAIGMLVVFAILIWQIALIKVPESRIFPMFATGIIGISGLNLLVRSCKGKDKGNVAKLKLHPREIVTFLILIAACFLFDIIGFYVTLLLMLIAISVCMEWPLTKNKAIFCTVYSIGVVVFCYICFKLILGLSTPLGFLI